MRPAQRSRWRGAGPRASCTRTRRPPARRPGDAAAAAMHCTSDSDEREADRPDPAQHGEAAALRRAALPTRRGGRRRARPPDGHDHGSLVLAQRVHIWVGERDLIPQVVDLVRTLHVLVKPCLERVDGEERDQPAAALRDGGREQPLQRGLDGAALWSEGVVEPNAHAAQPVKCSGRVSCGEVGGRDGVERAGVRVDRERLTRHVMPPQPRRRFVVILGDHALEEEAGRVHLDVPPRPSARDAAPRSLQQREVALVAS
mmetsp:Transcript_37796/g.99215  ORF Transcript_37796/g.99215 Transcript_37796/m.99215 type:complete len:258 (-) Transcript_37796:435-1208(-)